MLTSGRTSFNVFQNHKERFFLVLTILKPHIWQLGRQLGILEPKKGRGLRGNTLLPLVEQLLPLTAATLLVYT